MKEQKSKVKKQKKISRKKLIPLFIIIGILIYFIVVLYGLIKEPTNIFMVENRIA